MNETIPVMAVVLAAGKSSRMGQSKPLLPIGGIPMLELTLRKLLKFPLDKIVCITGHMHEAVQSSIRIRDSRFGWVYNPSYAEGQSTSLQAAVACTPDAAQGILVFLGDQPFIEPDTIARILSEAQLTKEEPLGTKSVIQPAFHGQKGHPVYFSRRMLAHFSDLAGDVGAKTIMKYAEQHLLVQVEDEGVVLDLDTMQDYEKHQPPK